MPDVFISFKSQDKAIAESIYEGLTARGVSCWISTRDVRPGTNYQEQITQAIRNCNVMILVFSHAAQQSPEIPRELALASQNKKPVIPVRIEAVEPNDVFAYTLATSQFLDVHDNFHRNFEDYVGQISKAVSYHLQAQNQGGLRSEALQPGLSLRPSGLEHGQQSPVESVEQISANSDPEISKTLTSEAGGVGVTPEFLKSVAEQTSALSLRSAYAFGIVKGLQREVAVIRDMVIEWDRSYRSSLRCGYVVELFESHGILEEFKKKHWSSGNTHAFEAQLDRYRRIKQQYIEFKAGRISESVENEDVESRRISTGKADESFSADSSAINPASNPAAAVVQESAKPGEAKKPFLVMLVMAIVVVGAGALYFMKNRNLGDVGSSVASTAIQSPTAAATLGAGDAAAKTDSIVALKGQIGNYPIESAEPIVMVMLRAVRDGHEGVFQQASERITQFPQPVRGDRSAARTANARGLEVFKNKDYATAIVLFLEAVGADNADEEAVNNVSYAFLMSGAHGEARQWAIAALTLNPNRSSAWFNLAMALAEQGAEDDAVGAFLLSHKHSNSSEKFTRFLIDRSDRDDASPKLKVAIQAALGLLVQPANR